MTATATPCTKRPGEIAMSILIQGGTLLCPEGPLQASLRVEEEKITEIGPSLPAGDSQVIDASGKLVFPGFIDTHTHFEMNKGLPNETADGWASGTLAALAGGTTTVLDFAEPERGADMTSALDTWHRRAEGQASCHYGFHMTRLFGMYPQKGALSVGSDADITILAPNTPGKITAAAQYQNVDYTPYEGMEVLCRVDTVLLSGTVAVENGMVTAPKRGRCVHRGASKFWR